MTATEFVGEFPIAYLDYKETTPSRSARGSETFSPLIPMNARDSGIPAVFFVVTVRNPGAKPVQASVAMSLQNFVGWDGFSSIERAERTRGDGGNSDGVVRDGERVSVVMENSVLAKADRGLRDPGDHVSGIRGPRPRGSGTTALTCRADPDDWTVGSTGESLELCRASRGARTSAQEPRSPEYDRTI